MHNQIATLQKRLNAHKICKNLMGKWYSKTKLWKYWTHTCIKLVHVATVWDKTSSIANYSHIRMYCTFSPRVANSIASYCISRWIPIDTVVTYPNNLHG